MEENALIEIIWNQIKGDGTGCHWAQRYDGADDCQVDGYIELRDLAKAIIEHWKEQCR